MRILLLALALLATLPAHAETVPAGFAPAQVWLSKSTPEAGERVEIYTVIYDASGTPIEGSVSFLVGGEVVGSVPFSLEEGDTAIRSVRWEATPGMHTLQARIDTALHAKTKQDAGLAGAVTATSSVTVGEKKEETSERTARTQSPIPDVLAAATSYPVVASVAAPFVSIGESVRTSAETLLSSYIGTSTPETLEEGAVLGTTTKAVDATSQVAQAALPFFAYPALFYPLALMLLLTGLWLVVRSLRNPKRKR